MVPVEDTNLSVITLTLKQINITYDSHHFNDTFGVALWENTIELWRDFNILYIFLL